MVSMKRWMFYVYSLAMACFAIFTNAQECYFGKDVSRIPVTTYSTCATKVLVDRENMLQFIRNVNSTFCTYYAFYDIARDPLDSIPLSYQPELGYTIYNSTDAGKVDLAKELDHLYLDVEDNGANLTTFWEVQKIFDRLLDDHIDLGAPFGEPTYAFSPTGYSTVFYVSQWIDNGTYTTARLNFRNNGSADVMSVTWFNEDMEPVAVQEVRSIGGLPPLDFLQYFSSIEGTTNNAYAYKAPGARINGLLVRSTGIVTNQLLKRAFYGNPAWLPPFLEVTFEDGSTDVWEAVVRNKGVFNITEIQQQINYPGKLYSIVQAAIGEATASVVAQAEKMTLRTASLRVSSASSASTKGLEFQIANGSANAENIGVAVIDDYLVMKVGTFNVEPYPTMVNAWNLATDVARSHGIEKLVLDLSQNLGGIIASGYALVACMFPELPYETLAQTYNFVYSDLIRVTVDIVLPFLDEIESYFQEGDNLQQLLNDIGTEGFGRIVRVSEALDILLEEEGGQLSTLAYQLNETRTIADMLAYVSKLTDTVGDFNALKAGGAVDFVDLPVQSAVRGGKNITLTGDGVYSFSEVVFDQIQESCKTGPFTKYVVLGDGTGGSTTCVTATFLQQTTPNNVNGPPVIAVSYGGTGEAETTPLTQFCGGSVLRPYLEDAYFPLGVLYLWQELLNTTDPQGLGTKASEAFDAYDDVLPDVPYFQNTPISMPVPMVYSNFMAPGAAPLEYVNFPAQGYIRQWYTATGFEDYDPDNGSVRYGGQDLLPLYQQSSQFF